MDIDFNDFTNGTLSPSESGDSDSNEESSANDTPLARVDDTNDVSVSRTLAQDPHTIVQSLQVVLLESQRFRLEQTELRKRDGGLTASFAVPVTNLAELRRIRRTYREDIERISVLELDIDSVPGSNGQHSRVVATATVGNGHAQLKRQAQRFASVAGLLGLVAGALLGWQLSTAQTLACATLGAVGLFLSTYVTARRRHKLACARAQHELSAAIEQADRSKPKPIAPS